MNPGKLLLIDAAVAVDHAQPPLDAQVVKAQHIGPQQGKKQQHFRGPPANTLQGAKPCNDFFVGKLRQGFQVKFSAEHLLSKFQNVGGFPGGDPLGLEVLLPQGRHVFRGDSTSGCREPAPNGSLGLAGNLLPHNVMDHSAVQAGHHFPFQMAQLVDDRPQFLVLAFQIADFFFAVRI